MRQSRDTGWERQAASTCGLPRRPRAGDRAPSRPRSSKDGWPRMSWRCGRAWRSPRGPHAELAALTADLPAGPADAVPPRPAVRAQALRPMSTAARAGMWVVVAAAAPVGLSLPTDGAAFWCSRPSIPGPWPSSVPRHSPGGMRSSPTAGSYRRLRAPGQAPRLMGMGMPETRYARSGAVMIACQVLGEGPFDVVIAPSFVSHVELRWEAAGLGCCLPVRQCGRPSLPPLRWVTRPHVMRGLACGALAGRAALIYGSKVCSLRAIAGSSPASAICSACATPRGRPARIHIA